MQKAGIRAKGKSSVNAAVGKFRREPFARPQGRIHKTVLKRIFAGFSMDVARINSKLKNKITLKEVRIIFSPVPAPVAAIHKIAKKFPKSERLLIKKRYYQGKRSNANLENLIQSFSTLELEESLKRLS